MNLEAEFIMKIEVLLKPAVRVGQSSSGNLGIIPIIGGTFSGPELKGTVCSGGADWNCLQSEDVSNVCARYWLLTDDGYVISVHNEGFIDNKNHALRIKTSPRFTVQSNTRYNFLNTGVFAAELLPGPKPDSVEIIVYKLK